MNERDLPKAYAHLLALLEIAEDLSTDPALEVMLLKPVIAGSGDNAEKQKSLLSKLYRLRQFVCDVKAFPDNYEENAQ